jgi:threonine dehydratase
VDAEVGSIAVDSLAPRQLGELTFAILSRYAAQVVLVDDDAIRQTQHMLWERMRVVAEPGGCAALAALLSGPTVTPPGGGAAPHGLTTSAR